MQFTYLFSVFKAFFKHSYHFFLLCSFIVGMHISANSQIVHSSDEWICIPEQKFNIGNIMGESDEKPSKLIQIDSFYILNHEVTNIEYTAFLNYKGLIPDSISYLIDIFGNWRNQKSRIIFDGNHYRTEKGFEHFPVNFVSWYGANEYCKWVNGRLPSEAEWELAAKNGFNKLDSSHLDSMVWQKNNSNLECHLIGTKSADNIGNYDMLGNLAEWCNDWYSPTSYKKIKRKNPFGNQNGDLKVYRGGSFANEIDLKTITNRKANRPDHQNVLIGFRVVRNFR